MSGSGLGNVNSGYVAQLLEDYLEAPASVPVEWRELFERRAETPVEVPTELSTDGPAGNGRSAIAPRAPGPAGSPQTATAQFAAQPAPDRAPALGVPPSIAPRPAVAPPSSPQSPEPEVAAAVPAVAPVPTVRPAEPREPAGAGSATDETLLGAVAAATALVKAFRMHGHLAADLDPLGSEPMGDPALDELQLVPSLTADVQERVPASVLRLYVPGRTLRDALPALRDVYTGSIAYQIEHISDHAERVWLRRAIESGQFRQPLAPDEQRDLLRSLSRVEAFEQFLRRSFLGQKQFSIEGLDALLPMLDVAIELAAADGAHEIVIGMAHRGRLNALAHTVGRSYEALLREFEGERTMEAVASDPEGGTGDVKYHLPGSGSRVTAAGEIEVTIVPNPSHLEAVDPVVVGRARAEQTDRSHGSGSTDPEVALPILIHGDASFPGQGVVAETLNLQSLAGYTVGGTLHLIANNQVGFTTDPADGRSTRYSSDLAKGFDIPIVHVNADDPEAALSAVRLALAYRREFGHDFVIDLVGYRRFGHNEQDEASYTQPLMVAQIARHPTVRERYTSRLVEAGVVTKDEAEAMVADTVAELRIAHERLRASFESRPTATVQARSVLVRTGEAVVTGVPLERLRVLNEELLAVPAGFEVNPKLQRQLERRLEAMHEGGIDWGQAEALAFATLLEDGIPIRLTGQDTERGTFSHRHMVLHDPTTGETYAPVQHLPGAKASFEVYNSPLSEYAALAFECGYSVAAPDALVLWEAQFGDFVNGAQVVVDQFIVSGRAKWGQTSRLTLLLPHGYEGNGPEHSSARLERFLQLAAQENIRIVNCSTSAQYFHMLRRQALDATARPLVAMTPKGLLRLRQASSSAEELADGAFMAVIDDPDVGREVVRRLVLCSGKLYYDIVGHDERSTANEVAVARLEQLYPFPVDEVTALVASYPRLEELVWAQEEPQNMGAWRSLRHRLEDAARAGSIVPRIAYVGRPWLASVSEGYPTAHLGEQERIVREALGRR